MNRELKFRAWDKLEGKWCSFFPHRTLNIISDNDNKEYLFFIPQAGGHEYSIQQYTGCHDSTNKEIYEGDILAYNHGNGTNIGYVGFTSGIFFLNYSDANNDELGYLLVSNIKIIGNIFEDPEFIK